MYRTEKKRRLLLLFRLPISFIFASSMLAVLLLADATFAQTGDITLSAIEIPNQEYGASQLPAEIGKPVQWVKKVDVQNLYDQAVSELTVSLPEDAMNVVAMDMEDSGMLDTRVESDELKITDSLEFNEQKSYVIKYETEAPLKEETSLVRKGDTLVKNVVISSDYHYEDVYTYTDIPETDKNQANQKIQLFWQINGVKTDVSHDSQIDLQFYDTNNNGKYDRISWITPHLSTQIFEVVIFSDANPGNFSAINLDLLYPANGQYITSTSKINFNYTVSYNSSTTAYCNLTVDGIVRRDNVQTASDTEITTYFNLTSGQHSWYVNCAGDDGSTNTSQTRTFTIDLDQPTVTLSTPDYHVSYTNSIRLNFTPVDEKYPVLVCSLSINRIINRTSIIVANNSFESILLTGLANGVYNWNVSCIDAAMNVGRSEERVFYISAGTPSAYNISPNKASYAIGEVGYLIINANPGSNLTMFVDTPQHDSFFRYYNGRTFPIIDTLNFTSNPGTYNIDGIFTNGADIYVIRTSFVAVSTFVSDIEANKTSARPGETIHFESNATGGIGGVNYSWDFGDGTSATGAKVDHAYSSVGEYEVEVTATDSRSNRVTDTEQISIQNLHDVMVLVKELQTGNLLVNVPVEIDDERKYTDINGAVNFTVYEGKRRVYVAHSGYEWVKQIRNITEDIIIDIRLNNTAITNYTPPTEQDQRTETQEQDAKTSAENMLAGLTAALEGLNPDDEATDSIMDALKIEDGIAQAIKELRLIIRDLGNAELSKDLTSEQKKERIENITLKLNGYKGTITGIEVEDTTEFVDYPKATDIAMLSEEYLRYKKIQYSKGEKEDYINANTKLQAEIAITSRISVVTISTISGDTRTAAVVINKIAKKPSDVSKSLIIEYLPKEVAQSASEIKKITAFEIIKGDPILKFSADTDEYSYYLEKVISLKELEKIKHVMLLEPSAAKQQGLGKITGFSILPDIKIENPKVVIEVIIILLLVLAYLVYHFELIDRVKEKITEMRGVEMTEGPDYAYDPRPISSSFTRKIGEFVKNEDALIKGELANISSLIMSAHSHADNNMQEKATETYKQIMDNYRSLTKEAKEKIHPETKHVFNKILLSKTNQLLDEAFLHIRNGHHKKAVSHYSEIKNIYSKLEKEHRAAVSGKCIKLHEKIFENTLN